MRRRRAARARRRDWRRTLNPAFFDYPARIDHVFAERGRFDLLQARIVLDAAGADGTWPSDHFGLYVRLRPRR